MPENAQTLNNSLSNEEAIARSKIGRQVTYFALATTFLLGFTAIMVALLSKEPDKEKFVYVKDILTIILPLVGTWVGNNRGPGTIGDRPRIYWKEVKSAVCPNCFHK